MTTLIVLHGFTQNGEQLRTHLAALLARLPSDVTPVIPDAPHSCSDAGLRRLERISGQGSWPPPHLCWWDSTNDGQEYRGWEQSVARIRELSLREGPLGVMGFSQGAILAAVLAGFAARGEFPELDFAVLVAGRKPRAIALAGLLDQCLQLPSLHVWGERDVFAGHAERLSHSFAPEGREIARWDGPHVVPTYGPGSDAIVDFIARRAADLSAPGAARRAAG